MSSTFYGLEIARKGLYASQKGLDVTGHNVANVNTPGYTRQRLTVKSIPPPANSGLYRSVGKGMAGGGVDIQSLDQIRDGYLDRQYRRESMHLGEWTIKSNTLGYIEDIFREPSDASINAALADLYASMQEMSKNPESQEIRTLVRQDAIKLTESIHHYYDQLVQLQKEQNDAIAVTVDEINDMVVQIRDLNEQIFKFEVGGEKANDLRDKRNMLLDELSQIIKLDYYESPDGRFRVDIDGMPLVDHMHYNLIEVRADKDNPIYEGQTGEPQYLNKLNNVYWKDSDLKVPINGGEIKGYVDMRDGNTPDNMGIPYMIRQLNNFAAGLTKAFNEVHSKGYPIPNDSKTYSELEISDEGGAGINFFEPPEGITAKNIKVSDAILESVFNIACSGQKLEPSSPNDPDYQQKIKNWGDNKNALEMLKIRNKNNIKLEDGILIGNLEDYFKKVISELAVESSHSTKMAKGQQILTGHIQNQRLSISGVSLDEEMTNLITYMHSYSAAARTITAMDEMLETLINRTGLVGR
ncbi:flagellar hook-associated protein FlgK [Xylanivirga thermophila]|uniref:flagellar hook-associated protein FlgK n=1 Tax=Xylanivirga thermophila TaxID=2496273 RepID=UPI00101CC819|nr:flagellar hook-associated protein FlgK [Xylanivirga thermophila]